MYPELRTSVSPDEREHLVLRSWKENNIFRRSVDERSAEHVFSFYEGPPTVNGTPGIHHIFSRALKDVICRYKTMCGYRVERKAGWDTHGLPVEIAIEKELGFRHKHDIEEYGVEKFNALCRQFVFDLIGRDGGFNEFTERMAYWVDLSDPYITCTNDYIESVWWALKKFHDAGLIYKGFKIQPYCPRCETALSSHEVALGYRQAKDPSVYVKFKRKNVDTDEYFLAWTTTPWTLISNVALAMHPDVDYVTVLNTRKDRAPERLVLAKALVSKLEGEVEVLAEHKGSDFEYQAYEPLFNYVPIEGKAFYVVLGDYVTTEDGTGIVHTAPAFGEDDFQISKKYTLPVINPVDKTGSFAPSITDFAGQFIKSADPAIMDNLKGRGLLYRKETIEHTYPFCWRCESPLIYYARDSWYIRVTEYKQKLISENKKINWQPPEIRDGRFGNWLEDLKDWGISRERFWGTPLPIWVCEACQKQKCVGSAAELAQPKDFDLHKPYVDEVTFQCNCGGVMRRTPEVIDVWFDSGSMPFAQHHFMGESASPLNYPADYISEGVDQTRGWFYTLHAINTFLFGHAPYRNVIVNDMLLDKNGQKMSKSKGNIVNPFEVMSRHGADATRWYLLSASVPWKPRSFNEDDLGELERKLFGTLTNTYGFFALYANIDKYHRSQDATKVDKRPEVDRWILSKLNSLVASCRADFDTYEVTRPARAIQDFVTEQLSNWYIRRNRRRFWKGEQGEDKQAAYDTLYECLLTISKLMSPIAPFFSDWLYSALGGPFDSIHLDEYPQPDPALIDMPLERRMEAAQVVSSLVRQMRERARLRVRQPLARILIPVADRREIEELRRVEDVIRDEVNVKRIEYVEAGDSDVIKLKAKANFKTLGSRLGKSMKIVAAQVQKLTQEEIRTYQMTGGLSMNIDGQNFDLLRGDIEVTAEDVEGWLVSSESGMTVALDTHMTPELEREGMAREFVNRVQNLRKDSGFDVTDRIGIHVASASEEIMEAVRAHARFIQEETLAESISSNGDVSGDASAIVDILERAVSIWLSRIP
ncbi:MAG: isoleucine--tRNA ligase [Bacteroidota bacterium]|nr:isoleucine--tRNA ligase [Bacteroidota bacterium]MDP4233450.1 isoleucine--tRNA ligase [Bacteroidota bacterium]MDP4287072.1 isoleucine--tRNA ligase [Bacteroidota bacterium]